MSKSLASIQREGGNPALSAAIKRRLSQAADGEKGLGCLAALDAIEKIKKATKNA